MKKAVKNVIVALCCALVAVSTIMSCVGSGDPTVDYQIVGDVTNTYGYPLSGIKVTLKDEDETMYTDSRGHYESRTYQSTDLSKEVMILFEDVDGEDNGGDYHSGGVKSKLNKLPLTIIKEGHKRYLGSYIVTVDVQMVGADEKK